LNALGALSHLAINSSGTRAIRINSLPGYVT
jgi:hypothetical protein